MKSRNPSRSSSSLNAPNVHPPLVSAVSDPALNINNNVLLAHLLTNSKCEKKKRNLRNYGHILDFSHFADPSNFYTMSAAPCATDKLGVPSQPVIGVKNILPMLSTSLTPGTQAVNNTSHHVSSSLGIQSMHTASNAQTLVQQQQQVQLPWL